MLYLKQTIPFQIFWGLSPTNFTWSILEYFVQSKIVNFPLNFLITLSFPIPDEARALT